jgi:transposase
MDAKLRRMQIINLEKIMSVKRKKYSKEYKLDAIQLYENGEKSMSQVERELGITDGLLSKWREDLRQANGPSNAFPGNGNLPEQEARNRQLERENAQLKQEKEILKNSAGDPLKGCEMRYQFIEKHQPRYPVG